jgi:glutathionylspermidine synthase
MDERYLAAWQLIRGRPELSDVLAADRQALEQALHRPGWSYAYPPPVLSAAAEAELESAGPALARLITDLPQRVFGEDFQAWANFLGVYGEDAQLVVAAAATPRFRDRALLFMRPDLIVTEQGLRLVELNVSTPLGGLSTHDPYRRVIGGLQVARLLDEQGVRLRAPEMAPIWLAALARAIGERSSPCTVFEATANPADLDSGRRFLLDLLESGGYRVCAGLVTDLQLGDDGVHYQGNRIDVVYTAYTWYETKRYVPAGLTSQLMELDRRNQVAFINAPATALFDSKANLELLTGPQHRHLMTAPERKLVERYVPETFRLTSDSYQRALEEQHELICKPALAYGGKGVSYGPAMSSSAWRSLLDERLAESHEEAYVCQACVAVAAVQVPALDTAPRNISLGPLVFGGRYAGTFYRQLPARSGSVINASQGAEVGAVLTGG